LRSCPSATSRRVEDQALTQLTVFQKP
jgi:hypothetical protein